MRRLSTRDLVVALLLALLAIPGCESPKAGPALAKPAKAPDQPVVLEYREIDLIPGEKTVKVKSGTAKSAKAEKESGLVAQADNDSVTVAATKDAQVGDCRIIIKNGKAKGLLTVHVKAANSDTAKPGVAAATPGPGRASGGHRHTWRTQRHDNHQRAATSGTRPEFRRSNQG